MNTYPVLSEARNALNNIKSTLLSMPLKELIANRKEIEELIADYDNFSLRLNEILELCLGDWE